ncbi:MAG TPA: hypothetical protein VNX47_07300 [Nevskia sp.]|jgi:hypothetical protein|nr:hypothetical protein [Nevskia sp.]
MKLMPEARHSVNIIAGEIVHRPPEGKLERVPLSAITRVLIETNDSGPWGTDVWWIVEGRSEGDCCCFPQGATGEAAVIHALSALPGFKIRGMNSVENRQFECWPNPDP